MIPFILLIPVLAAAAGIALLDSKSVKNAKYVALAGSLVSLALLFAFTYSSSTINWFSINGVSIGITALVTPVNYLLLFIVLSIAPLILFYSFGFMQTSSEQKRYYLEMLVFEASMLLFAMSGSLVTLVIAWEFLSVLSYMLIGFWHNRERTAAAARKAITTVIIGDITLLAAVVILWSSFGNLNLLSIFSSSALTTLPISPSIMAAAVLLIIAILTKSAQFPFQEWLPDAMEGPTPVSAFLHSSTMVKAGVFSIILLYPIFYSTGTLALLLILAVITVVLSTLNAMKEKHIKRVIAYSTVQELALMTVAASLGAIPACLYFFLVQSFYKALLFFSAGSIMHASKEEDLDKASGLKTDKLIYITTLVGVLSLAGFIPFSGFFASIGLSSSLSTNLLIYILISAVSLATSFFIFRWFLLSSKDPDPETSLGYTIIPKSMKMAMLIIAVLALGMSLLFFFLPSFLKGSYYLSSYMSTSPLRASFSYDWIAETVLVAAGAAASFFAFRRKFTSKPSLLTSMVYNSKTVNAAYGYFAAFVYGLAEGIELLDKYLNDVFDDLGKATLSLSGAVRRASVGNINLYILVFSISVVVIFSYIYLSGIL